MKRILGTLLSALFVMVAVITTPAKADTTASFNGCVYHAVSYLDAVNMWFAAGTPYCGVVYSVSVDTTVSGTVPPEDPPADTERSSWG